MGMKQGREYRAVQDFSLVPRAEEKDEYRVRGTAVVFDTPTVLFEYDGVKYSEVIDRNAFDECDMSDVIFNYNHGGKVVARLRNKTLTLTIDERGWILVAEQTIGGFVFFNLWEPADWGIEAVIRIVVVALADFAQQNSAGTGFDLEIMIHVLLDMDALTRRQAHLRSSRNCIGSAIAVDGHIGFAVNGLVG